jgi:hypothetical protein
MKMERALAEESKAVGDKQTSITKMTQANAALEKKILGNIKELEAARMESAAKDVRISQLQEQMRSGARQLDEQVGVCEDFITCTHSGACIYVIIFYENQT